MYRAAWHGFGFIYSYFDHESHSLFNVDVFSGGIYDLAKFPYFIVRAMAFMIITHDIFKTYVFLYRFVAPSWGCLSQVLQRLLNFVALTWISVPTIYFRQIARFLIYQPPHMGLLADISEINL